MAKRSKLVVVAALIASCAFASAACSFLLDTGGLTAESSDASGNADDGSASFEGGAIVDGANDAPLTTDSGPTNACPGTAGAPGIRVFEAGPCIDTREVTVGDYRAFLAARAGDTSGQPEECTWNTSFAPQYGMPPAAEDENAINFVDHCDAIAYCTWAGKRLCGGLGDGGPIALSDLNDAKKSEWFNACSHNDDGLHTYAYGNEVDPLRCVCNAWFDAAIGGPTSVSKTPNCQGPVPGLFNLSGNVYEMDNSCEPFDASADASTRNCAMRGGSWYNTPGNLTCSTFLPMSVTDRNSGVGFRCCSG